MHLHIEFIQDCECRNDRNPTIWAHIISKLIIPKFAQGRFLDFQISAFQDVCFRQFPVWEGQKGDLSLGGGRWYPPPRLANSDLIQEVQLKMEECERTWLPHVTMVHFWRYFFMCKMCHRFHKTTRKQLGQKRAFLDGKHSIHCFGEFFIWY